MTKLSIGLVLMALSTGVAIADDPKTPPPSTQQSGPVNKFCAVEGEPHDVDPTVTYEYQGKTIGFCCKDCIEPFKKDPEKFMKNLK